MQSLEVISINLWQILISLCNLLILFFILKKFLYLPVRKILSERSEELKRSYEEAEHAKEAAQSCRQMRERQLLKTGEETDEILENARNQANHLSEKIVAQAKSDADIIIANAKKEVKLEKERAEAEIKREIVDVSAVLAEKILSREIDENVHRAIIDEVISKIGDEND